MVKIEIGSGINRHEGFISCDFAESAKPEKLFNCEKEKWPFEDDCAEEVLAENLCEHLTDLDFFMKEAYRVLQPKGKLNILVPYYKHECAFSDPDHVRQFTEKSMMYYCKTTLGSDQRPVDRGLVDFDLVNIQYMFDAEMLKARGLEINDAFKLVQEKGLNGDCVQFLRFSLVAVKPARFGGKA